MAYRMDCGFVRLFLCGDVMNECGTGGGFRFKDRMSRDEAMEILKLYRGWNPANVGTNAHEEKILSERRALISAAMLRLQSAEVENSE